PPGLSLMVPPPRDPPRAWPVPRPPATTGRARQGHVRTQGPPGRTARPSARTTLARFIATSPDSGTAAAIAIERCGGAAHNACATAGGWRSCGGRGWGVGHGRSALRSRPDNAFGSLPRHPARGVAVDPAPLPAGRGMGGDLGDRDLAAHAPG